MYILDTRHKYFKSSIADITLRNLEIRHDYYGWWIPCKILFISDIPDANTVYRGYQIKPLGIIDILDTNILYRACYQAYMYVCIPNGSLNQIWFSVTLLFCSFCNSCHCMCPRWRNKTYSFINSFINIMLKLIEAVHLSHG